MPSHTGTGLWQFQVVDCRPQLNAEGNRFKGGGHEDTTAYNRFRRKSHAQRRCAKVAPSNASAFAATPHAHPHTPTASCGSSVPSKRRLV